jgi:hypothetical protein
VREQASCEHSVALCGLRRGCAAKSDWLAGVRYANALTPAERKPFLPGMVDLATVIGFALFAFLWAVAVTPNSKPAELLPHSPQVARASTLNNSAPCWRITDGGPTLIGCLSDAHPPLHTHLAARSSHASRKSAIIICVIRRKWCGVVRSSDWYGSSSLAERTI